MLITVHRAVGGGMGSWIGLFYLLKLPDVVKQFIQRQRERSWLNAASPIIHALGTFPDPPHIHVRGQIWLCASLWDLWRPDFWSRRRWSDAVLERPEFFYHERLVDYSTCNTWTKRNCSQRACAQS